MGSKGLIDHGKHENKAAQSSAALEFIEERAMWTSGAHLGRNKTTW